MARQKQGIVSKREIMWVTAVAPHTALRQKIQFIP